MSKMGIHAIESKVTDISTKSPSEMAHASGLVRISAMPFSVMNCKLRKSLSIRVRRKKPLKINIKRKQNGIDGCFNVDSINYGNYSIPDNVNEFSTS